MNATGPPASGGKKTAWIAGLGVAVVGLLALVVWKEFVVEYHLMALRQDPGLMGSWVRLPADSTHGIALGRFLASSQGVEALRRSFLEGTWKLLEKEHKEFLPGALEEGQIVQVGLYDLQTSTGAAPIKYFLIDGPTTLTLPVDPKATFLAVEPLFEFLGSGDFRLDEHPGIRFTIWSSREDPDSGRVAVEIRLSRQAGGGAP